MHLYALTLKRHNNKTVCNTQCDTLPSRYISQYERYSYGDRQISTPYKINTPEPIDKKFRTIDYVREGTSYTKFGRNPFTGGFWANG